MGSAEPAEPLMGWVVGSADPMGASADTTWLAQTIRRSWTQSHGLLVSAFGSLMAAPTGPQIPEGSRPENDQELCLAGGRRSGIM